MHHYPCQKNIFRLSMIWVVLSPNGIWSSISDWMMQFKFWRTLVAWGGKALNSAQILSWIMRRLGVSCWMIEMLVYIYNWWGKMKLLKSVIFMLNYFLKAILLFIWSDVSNYGVYNISPLVSYIKSFCLPLFWDSTLPLYEHNCLQLLICYFLNLTLIGNEINK